jgi:hypothetical protein
MDFRSMNELRIDADLRNTNNWNNPVDEFNRFFRFSDGKGINNVSGFRPKSRSSGVKDIENCAFCVLVTTFEEVEWPDSLDQETGVFTYFGDKREEGDLHVTEVGGNRLLRTAFNHLHTGNRTEIPPFLVFQRRRLPDGTYMRFVGLAAPGGRGVSAYDDLVAVWRVKEKTRFQNYRARFSILNEPAIAKEWLEDLVRNVPAVKSVHCPPSWKEWVQTGRYDPLTCERTHEPRSRIDQEPRSEVERRLLELIRGTFTDREFEFAAAELVQMMDPRFSDFLVTQRGRDGGRDALGSYTVGHDSHRIKLSVIVEAKLWDPNREIGVKPMARLISRIKHRDIGVFVSTSFFGKQVQLELIEDNHPVILISGGDIARLLIANELDVPAKFGGWASRIKHRSTSLA